MPELRTWQQGTGSHNSCARQTQVARGERTRLVGAIRELENALATPSWRREQTWTLGVQGALDVLQTALKETRESANAEGSLLSEVVEEAPRLENRVNRLREEFGDLERQVASLGAQISSRADDGRADVGDIRQRLRWLITALHHVQAKETELLYEALHVDIGAGD